MLHSLNNCDFDTNSISDLIGKRERESSRGIKRKRIKQHRERKKEKQIEFDAVLCVNQVNWDLARWGVRLVLLWVKQTFTLSRIKPTGISRSQNITCPEKLHFIYKWVAENPVKSFYSTLPCVSASMFNLLRAFKSLKCVSYILATSGFGTKGLADLFMSAFLIMLI